MNQGFGRQDFDGRVNDAQIHVNNRAEISLPDELLMILKKYFILLTTRT